MNSFYTTALLIVCFLMTTTTTALSPVKTVVVSGAGGQTGKALFYQLLNEKDDFETVIGIVRTETSKETLLQDKTLQPDNIVVCDVTDEAAVKTALEWNNVDALCICTSGTPSPTGEMKDGRPVFGYPKNGDPEIVDWIGQKSQIDAMSQAGGGHIVVCSSMGGTDPNNMLNSIGKTTDSETGEEKGGNILMWKRKSEKYLIEQASKHLQYTIVHPGGLINEPGNERELIVGVDDDRETYGGEGSPRTVPREDVARVMMEALRHPEAYKNRSFDLRAHEPVEGKDSANTDFAKLLDPLKGKNCDYSLGKSM